jgi:predicted Zn-dependent protease
MNLTLANAILTTEEALSLVEATLKESQAEGVFVALSQSESSLGRFSENQIGQNISKNRFKINITSYFGQKCASASTTELEPTAIAATVKRSEELARFAPQDPEWVPLLEPQIYESRIAAFDRTTADISPLERGEWICKVCNLAKNAGVEGSGTLSTNAAISAIGNSNGLLVSDRYTEADFSFTARRNSGSSWQNRTAWRLDDLPIEQITAQTIDRALASIQPREIQPGDYTVVFDPAATSSLIPWLCWNLDARAADEGRSFMSRFDKNGLPAGNLVGEPLFNPLVQIQRNPAHPLLQTRRFFNDGLSNSYLDIVKDGIPQTLSYSRYWAQQQNKLPTGVFYPIVMEGGEQTLEELIAQTERGILVSRAWYVRYVNPRTLEVTGMTRDGTFWIENGKVAYPIKNLRFNQSLPKMLENVEALSEVYRFGDTVVPGMKVKNFHFSSITDSI